MFLIFDFFVELGLQNTQFTQYGIQFVVLCAIVQIDEGASVLVLERGVVDLKAVVGVVLSPEDRRQAGAGEL